MRIGSLRHRLAFQHNAPTRDQYGQVEDSWQTIDTVYGKIRPMSGEERLRAGMDVSVVTHRAHIRHRTDIGELTLVSGGSFDAVSGATLEYVGRDEITSAQRVSYAGRTFDIEAWWDIDERHRFDELMLREVSKV